MGSGRFSGPPATRASSATARKKGFRKKKEAPERRGKLPGEPREREKPRQSRIAGAHARTSALRRVEVKLSSRCGMCSRRGGDASPEVASVCIPLYAPLPDCIPLYAPLSDGAPLYAPLSERPPLCVPLFTGLCARRRGAAEIEAASGSAAARRSGAPPVWRSAPGELRLPARSGEGIAWPGEEPPR